MTESWAIVVVALLSSLTTIVASIITNKKAKTRTDKVQQDVSQVRHTVAAAVEANIADVQQAVTARNAVVDTKLDDLHSIVNSKNEMLRAEITRLTDLVAILERRLREQ